MPVGRRRLLLALGTLPAWPAPAFAQPGSDLEEHELEVPGERLARRALVLVPRSGPRPDRLVVLFHGLGETSSEALGIRAFADRYGLVAADRRLRRPPVERTLKDAVYLTDERIGEVNAELAREAYRGLSLVCPYTPNVFRQPSTAAALDRYATWVVEGLLPVVRRSLALPGGAESTGVDGVSLGGYVSLEVFLRKPEVFGAAGCLQGAFSVPLADVYAARFAEALARVGRRSLRIASSSWDKGKPASDRLVKKLRERGIACASSVTPGPHDQRWLREVGCLDALLHYDRALSGPRGGTP
ncbi:MAG TPA: alpha/beta hydrolase-fold protein [Polyangiaceae bacterium]